MPSSYYVYSPITGVVTGQNTYCGGTHHPHVRLSRPPTDIAPTTTGLIRIDFHASANVRSIRAVNRPRSVCANPNIPPPWNHGLEVEIYSQPEAPAAALIGRVFYAHAQWPIADDIYNTNSGGLAWIASDECGCSCYQGEHVHVEAQGATVRTLICHTILHAGVDWLFVWQV